MNATAAMLPLLGLRIQAGPVELRGITDDLLGPLADLAVAGIHAPEKMPFYVPWTATPAEELPRVFAQYQWKTRAEFSPEQWTAEFAVFWDGTLVGLQGVSTKNYQVTRTGATGSWLGRAHQGKGIGTAMRQVLCVFMFDYLGADHMTSEAFTDNPASWAVSQKVGYTENGWHRVDSQGRPATMRDLLLERKNFVRYGHELAVYGLSEFRQSIGFDR